MTHPGRTCPHCGAAVSSPFCTSCGRPVETAPLFAPTPAQAPHPTVRRDAPPAPTAPTAPQPVVAQPRTAYEQPAPPPRSGTGARTLLLRAGIAFVLLIAT